MMHVKTHKEKTEAAQHDGNFMCQLGQATGPSRLIKRSSRRCYEGICKCDEHL